MFTVLLVMNGIVSGYAYVTCTCTRPPGLLHPVPGVPVEQRVQTTGVVLFELYQEAVTDRFEVLIPGKLRSCKCVRISDCCALQFGIVVLSEAHSDPRTRAHLVASRAA